MTHYDCPACGKSAFPTFVLNDRPGRRMGALIVQCANVECCHIDVTLGPGDFSSGTAVVHGHDGKTKTVHVSLAPAAASTVSAATPAPSPASIPPATAPGDVLAWVEERYTWLAAEDARLAGASAKISAERAGISAERKALERVLRAARRAGSPVIRDTTLRAVS